MLEISIKQHVTEIVQVVYLTYYIYNKLIIKATARYFRLLASLQLANCSFNLDIGLQL